MIEYESYEATSFFFQSRIIQINTVHFYRNCTRHPLKMGSLRVFGG